MKLFNKDNNGAEEIVAAVGIISNDIAFDKWEPILPLGLRDLRAIIGSEPINGLDDFYRNGIEDEKKQEALFLARQAVTFFTWLKMIPTLDAQHDGAGRGKRLGENEKGLTALQEFKDEENIRRLAYEAVDALIEVMDLAEFDFWENSEKKKGLDRLLIRNKNTFDQYYTIGSHRLFISLIPIIREVQSAHVMPIVGRERFEMLLKGDTSLPDALIEQCCRPIALLTMAKAVERFPVEVLPEGIVQVNQSAPVSQRLRAEKEARDAVADSLTSDANRYLVNLQDTIKELDAQGEAVDYFIAKPIEHSKGITF